MYSDQQIKYRGGGEMFKFDSKQMKRRVVLGEIEKYVPTTELLYLHTGKSGDIILRCHASKLYEIDIKKPALVYFKPPETADHPLHQGDVLALYNETLDLRTYRTMCAKISQALGAEGY
jgi:hypothetical protein